MWGPNEEVSEKKNIINWPGLFSCDVLAMIVAPLCPCPKSMLEAKLKLRGNGIGRGNFKAA